MMVAPPAKKQKTDDSTSTSKTTKQYTLFYHAGLPGRGEAIRLLFEATGTPYIDTAKREDTAPQVYKLLGDDASSSALAGNVQPFAPPCLLVSSTPDVAADANAAGEGGDDHNSGSNDLLISQTANILLYLGEHLGLAGADDGRSRYQTHGLALTACDLTNEAHDTHHPVAVMKYYEDQKAEALKKSADFRETRIPKFLGYFERVLRGNAAAAGEGGNGQFFVGEQLTYADLIIWQTLDGLKFAFPNEMKAREEQQEFPLLFGTFYPSVKEHPKIKEYLASDRREPYSNGIFRYYPELDRQ